MITRLSLAVCALAMIMEVGLILASSDIRASGSPTHQSGFSSLARISCSARSSGGVAADPSRRGPAGDSRTNGRLGLVRVGGGLLSLLHRTGIPGDAKDRALHSPTVAVVRVAPIAIVLVGVWLRQGTVEARRDAACPSGEDRHGLMNSQVATQACLTIRGGNERNFGRLAFKPA